MAAAREDRIVPYVPAVDAPPASKWQECGPPMPWPDRRLFFMTWNNPDDDAEEVIKKALDSGKIEYMAYCLEEGEVKKTPHYQIYLAWNTAGMARLETVNKRFGGKVWARYCEAKDSEESRSYCLWYGKWENKPGRLLAGPWEYGIYTHYSKQQGQHMNPVYADVKAGYRGAALYERNFAIMMRYHNGVEKMCTLLDTSLERTELTVGMWFYGKTGTGKTTRATAIGKQRGRIYYKNGRHKWWLNYRQQPTVIIDDYRYNRELDTITLLNLCDSIPYDVQFHGGTAQFNSSMVIITSNASIDATFQHEDADTRAALHRRYAETAVVDNGERRMVHIADP